MPRFAANLTLMFNDAPFMDRFERAAVAGFRAVEFLFPYDQSPAEIGAALQANGLRAVLFNLPPGDWAAGDRGLACLPDRFEQLMESVETALPYVKATEIPQLHLLAGAGSREDPRQVAAFVRSVAAVADRLAAEGVDVLLEPINRRDIPGYFLDDFGFASAIIEGLRRPNLKLQFDVYHRQILHGDVSMALRSALPIIGHIQIASVPSRQEPAGEELNWPFLFNELDRLGYAGFVGCEYRPAGRTEDGLGWFEAYACRP